MQKQKTQNTKKAPTDAYIIQYLHEDKVHYDLTRGTKVTLFDMYWDKFKGGLKSINYGNGGVKPNLWGYSAPKPKGKKRKQFQIYRKKIRHIFLVCRVL